MQRRIAGLLVVLGSLGGCAMFDPLFDRGPAPSAATGRTLTTIKAGREAEACEFIKSRFEPGRVFCTDEHRGNPLPAPGAADVIVFSRLGVVIAMTQEAAHKLRGAGAVAAGIGPGAVPRASPSVGGDTTTPLEDASEDEGVSQIDPVPTEATECPTTTPAGASGATENDRSPWGLVETRVAGCGWTGRGVKVAVLDSGMAYGHPDFPESRVPRNNRAASAPGAGGGNTTRALQVAGDALGHGTKVAGVVCGQSERAPGPGQDALVMRYGVAPDAELYVCQVTNGKGRAEDHWVLAGIEWAMEQGCEVICIAWGNPGPPSRAYEIAGRRALERGVLIVAAAGNDGRLPGEAGAVQRPANARTVMAVGAIDSGRRVAAFSAHGPVPTVVDGGPDDEDGGVIDLVAPGTGVFTSRLPGSGAPSDPDHDPLWEGTSTAAPFVAGIAALYIEASDHKLLGRELWKRMKADARRLPADADHPAEKSGAGLVQAPAPRLLR